MLYAILAYHEEEVVTSWSADEDAAVMTGLFEVHDRHKDRIGPTARLGYTHEACTLRTKGGKDVVVDGPFAETKEALLGLYIVDMPGRDEAIQAARDLKAANPSAVYEIRPVMLYLPGVAVTDGSTV